MTKRPRANLAVSVHQLLTNKALPATVQPEERDRGGGHESASRRRAFRPADRQAIRSRCVGGSTNAWSRVYSTIAALTNVRNYANIKEAWLATNNGNFFRDGPDQNPSVVKWLDGLPERAQQKCLARLKRLEDLSHELRRPEADYLRDGVYELRSSYQGVHYRMLYFFHGRAAVVISHGITKEREIPSTEIDRAIRAKQSFEANPSRHTFRPGRS